MLELNLSVWESAPISAADLLLIAESTEASDRLLRIIACSCVLGLPEHPQRSSALTTLKRECEAVGDKESDSLLSWIIERLASRNIYDVSFLKHSLNLVTDPNCSMLPTIAFTLSAYSRQGFDDAKTALLRLRDHPEEPVRRNVEISMQP